MSQLSPYLAAGVVATDAPEHRARRALLNPAFHRRVVTPQFAERFAAYDSKDTTRRLRVLLDSAAR